MAASLRIAGRSAAEAFRTFTWGEYAPLLFLLAAQWLYLLFGLNLGAAWGMAVSGTIAHWLVGDAGIDYPGFLQILPVTFSYVESATFIVVGAFVLPFVVARVLARVKPSRAQADAMKARIRAAFLPTFLALLAGFLLTYAWQIYVSRGLHALLAPMIRGGLQSATATWIVSVFVGYAITTLLIFVPVVAVSENVGPLQALGRGVKEGWTRFATTYPFAILLSAPALLLQFVVQIGGGLLASRTRPENLAYLLLLYVVASTVATYFVWNMATRYYHARVEAA